MSNWGTTTQGQDCHCSRTHSGRNNRQTKPWRNSTRLHTKPWTWEGKAPGNSTGWNLTTCKAAMLERTGAGHEPAGTQSVNCEKWSFASTHPCQTTFIILCPVFLFPAPLSSRNTDRLPSIQQENSRMGKGWRTCQAGKGWENQASCAWGREGFRPPSSSFSAPKRGHSKTSQAL